MVLPVRAFPDIIRGVAGPVHEFARPDAATLADLVALVPIEHEALRPHLRVLLNGEMIDPALYRLIRPKGDCYVTIVLPLQGGGDSGNILGVIAAVALIGASLFVGGFGLPFLGTAFAAGSAGAQIIAGGLSLAASLLLQGLNAPKAGNTQEAAAAAAVGVASAQNAFEPGAYLQRVIGTRKVTPQMVMPPYTEIEGDNQYVVSVYGLAGPHRIEQVRIGPAEIDGTEDVAFEVREGFASDAALTLVTDTRIEVALGIKLSEFQLIQDISSPLQIDTSLGDPEPFWHRVETKRAPDKARLFLQFDSGLVQIKVGSSGTPAAAVTAIRVRMRRKGTSAWKNLPELVVRGNQAATALRLMLDFEWLPAGSIPSATAFTANYGGWSWKYDSITDDTTAVVYWTADSYFASKVSWESNQQVKVYLDTATFPLDAYEIEIKRGFTVEESLFTSATHNISWSGVYTLKPDDFFSPGTVGGNLYLRRSPVDFAQSASIALIQSIWNEYPFDLAGQPTALIAIRAKNRSIDQVTCLASGYVSDWDGAAWVANRVSSNPAAWYQEVLRGDLNAEPVPDSLIDDANMVDWYEWCDAAGLEVNAVLQGQPVTECLSLIAQAGMARPRYSATHGVVIDRTREAVGLVTQRNASGFSFQKPFGRLPHALRVNLADEENDYEVREVVVYADGYNADGSGGLTEASRFESITYPGITSEVGVEERAKRDMRFARHRSRLITFSLDIEYLQFALGDMVLLETDILGQIGGRGRVKSIIVSGGLVTRLGMDEERDFTEADAGGSPRAIAMRLMDGTVRVERVTGDDSDLSAVTFTTPFAMPTSGGDDLIVPGTLVATGALGREARRVLIWDMAPGRELTAQVTAIDYAEDRIFDHLLIEDGWHLLTEDEDFIDIAERDIGDRLLLPDGYSLRLPGGYLLLE